VSEDFEFSQSAGQSDIAPGTYLVTLTEISEVRTIIPRVGPNAGQERDLRDWTFATEDGQEITDSAAVSRSPRSKAYTWTSALFGQPVPLDKPFPISSLIGREAIATIGLNDGGWPKILNLSAKPKSGKQTVAPPPPTRAVDRKVAPVAAGIADDLPF
jgi:hypothetical protein